MCMINKPSRCQKCLFIFRRDLRLYDNTGLIYALEHSKSVIPCFIFTPEQIDKNPYRSDHCVQFMIESLEDLGDQLKKKGGRLYLFYGKPEQIVEQCIDHLHVDSVIANRDYTPHSQKRDKNIEKTCRRHQIDFLLFEDALLHTPEETLKADGKPYKVFSPYFRHVSGLPVLKPRSNQMTNYFNGRIAFSQDADIYHKILPKRSKHLLVKGGRKAGNRILETIGRFSNYAAVRDFPGIKGTTNLSPYLKFTIISPREVYFVIVEHFGRDHALIRALFWRDFFSSIAFFFPHVFSGAFYRKFDRLKWSYDKQAFKKWCQGQTGFPIVDAGMRELNNTGFMHNRVRMIVASFLTKDLHLSWRWGEKYFAQNLIDYDPAVNNGNWQWSASTGCDAQPYFRIFNPWAQQKKFDPDCTYIKEWIPELKLLPSKSIHRWWDEKLHSSCPDYTPPMLDHDKEAKIALKLYRAVKPKDGEDSF